MRERLTQLRKFLNLSMEEFGNKLGVTRSAISRLESGSSNFTEQMIKSICREFSVDYIWLTTGNEEMFSSIPETIVDELALEFDLDDIDKSLIQEYLKLSKDDRQVLKNYMKDVFKH